MKKGQPAANMMDRLPREIVMHILSRLPLTSLLSSKLVCRAWRTLIQDPFLISRHLLRMAEAGNDPSFILENNWPIPNQHHFIDFFDHSEGKVISKKLPASYPTSPMHLIDSCNGLLCMRDASRTVYVCNPFTRLYIELPKMIRYATLVSHLQFGFHRTTKEYKAIQIVYRRQLRRVNSSATTTTSVHSDVQILTIGSPGWRNLGTIPYGFITSKSKALVNGRLHWLSMPNKYTKAILLISFDLETEQFQEVPKPDCCCGSPKCFRELTVVRGCLSVGAFHDHDERLEIWVMKDYGVKESWVKEFSFGTYLPLTLMKQQGIRHFSYPRPNLFVRVVCVLKSGEILLEYKNRALVIYDPRKHLSHMAKADNDPSFILESNWPILDQHYFVDFFDHSGGKVISKKLPASSPTTPMYLVDSCNGLLCMRDTSRTVYICNPFTRLYIELPQLIKYKALVCNLEFGFHRTTKQYKVIQIVYRRRLRRFNSSDVSSSSTTKLIQSDVQILTIGSPSWRDLGTIPYRFIQSNSKALVNGRFHWLSIPNKYTNKSILLISFDIETEQFQEVSKPDCRCGSDRCFRQLMVLRGCLSAGAFHDHDERLEIWVMKDYGVKKSWIKEFSIGTYLPPTLMTQQGIRHFSYSRPNLFVRVLSVLKSGEILLEYKSRALVVYDPLYETFKEFKFPEMPDCFKIIVHVGSLNWLHN